MTEATRGPGAVEFVPDGGELLQAIERLKEALAALTLRVEQLETHEQ
jgi:hypothetical protein